MSGATIDDGDLAAHWRDVTSGVHSTERQVERVLEGSGIPAQWFQVLDLLLRTEDHRMPMSVLARGLSMTSGGFTKLADRMAREQLIDRRGSAADRRVVYATLTADGLAMAQRATRLYQDALRECVLDVVDVDQLASVASAMRALNVAHAEALPDDGADDPAVMERTRAEPDRRLPGR